MHRLGHQRTTLAVKDRTGRVIGFEKLNFAPADPRNVAFDFETVGA